MLLRDAFRDTDTAFATTVDGLGERAGLQGVHLLPDCNRNRPLEALWCLIMIIALLVRTRPHVVISTGALPGVIALAIGKRLGARTIWVDSIANAEEMSMAGRKAERYADLWLSQWPAVAEQVGARHMGSVL